MKINIMIGIPAIGKSTYSSDRKGFRLSSDDYIEQHAALHGKTYNDVFKDYAGEADRKAKDLFRRIVDANELDEIWIDRTNMRAKARSYWINYAKKKGNEFYAYDFKAPATEQEKFAYFERLNGRPGKTIPLFVITGMLDTYEAPTLEEGFKEIFEVPFSIVQT